MKIIKDVNYILVAILLFTSCAAVNKPVVIDYDREADFKEYQTFYWADEFQQNQYPNKDNPLFYNTLNKKRLKKAIEDEMGGRGYQLDSEDPDLLIDSRIIVEQGNSTSYTQNPYFFGYYYPYTNTQTTTTTTRKEGSVIIELIDKKEK